MEFLTKPIETFFTPLSLWVSKFSVTPTFGRENLEVVFNIAVPKPYSPLYVPWDVLTATDSPGVIVTCEYLATAEPAGLIPIEPGSPPRAVNAFPIARVRAVP